MSSTGVEAIDSLIGIGAGSSILHSLTILDENFTNGYYSSVIERCFIAEGLDNNERLFMGEPFYDRLLQKLQTIPSKSGKSSKICREDVSNTNTNCKQEDDFKIAWRYKEAPVMNSSIGAISRDSNQALFEPKFDLSQSNDDFTMEDIKEKITIFGGNMNCPSIDQLWQSIHQKYMSSKPSDQILRIVISDLSSLIWDENNLPIFFAQLKAFSRHLKSVILVTLDSTLLKQETYQNCVSYADAVFQMQKMDEQKQRELHLRQKIDGGMFYINKLPSIMAAAPAHIPHSFDLTFSKRRRFFELKLLHLPPALGDNEVENKEIKSIKMPCQSIVDNF